MAKEDLAFRAYASEVADSLGRVQLSPAQEELAQLLRIVADVSGVITFVGSYGGSPMRQRTTEALNLLARTSIPPMQKVLGEFTSSLCSYQTRDDRLLELLERLQWKTQILPRNR